MAGASTGKIDVLRKSLIIACLVAGMVVLHHFNTTAHEFDPTGMLALGFVILASYTVGELVGVIKLPHITGYLFAGLFSAHPAYMIPEKSHFHRLIVASSIHKSSNNSKFSTPSRWR